MSRKKGTSLFGLLVGGAAAAAGGWLLYSRFGVDHQITLPKAFPAQHTLINDPTAGRVSYYSDRAGSGAPLLLVHSVNAAASAFEMATLFEHFRRQRPVFALDLPGYGFSERSERQYSPQVMTAAVSAVLAEIGAPTDVVALSLGSEFAARAALHNPQAVRSLTLISPTGFATRDPARGGNGTSTHSALSFQLWEQALFDLIATRRSIHYFLQKSFTGSVPPEMVDYAYRTSHRPGAQHAPLYFLSGLLFTPGVREAVYSQISVPVLVIHDRDPYTSFDTLPAFTAEHPNWQAQRISPTLGLPHWEHFSRTIEIMQAFWKEKATSG